MYNDIYRGYQDAGFVEQRTPQERRAVARAIRRKVKAIDEEVEDLAQRVRELTQAQLRLINNKMEANKALQTLYDCSKYDDEDA